MQQSIYVGVLLGLNMACSAMADDWPTYSHDNARSLVTTNPLDRWGPFFSNT